MTTNIKPWEEVRDIIAGAESYDPDTIAYDRKERDGTRRNLAGIVPPKPISQMTIGELNDWQETEMRNKSRAYGLTLPNRQAELRRQGFKDDPGSTGVGRYQFEKSTLVDTAKELYGDSYRDVVFDADVQDKLGKHLYNKAAARGPEALGNTWNVLRNPSVSAGSSSVANEPKSTSGAMIATAGTIGAGGVLASTLGGSAPVPDIDAERKSIGTLSQWEDPRQLYSVSRSRLRNMPIRADFKSKLPDQPSNAQQAIRTAQRILKQTTAKATKKPAKGKKVPMVARLQKVDGKMKRVLVPQIAENTVRFKDLRNKIYEQIIINEEKENINESLGFALSQAVQSNFNQLLDKNSKKEFKQEARKIIKDKGIRGFIPDPRVQGEGAAKLTRALLRGAKLATNSVDSQNDIWQNEYDSKPKIKNDFQTYFPNLEKGSGLDQRSKNAEKFINSEKNKKDLK